jgi:hypothetical protein
MRACRSPTERAPSGGALIVRRVLGDSSEPRTDAPREQAVRPISGKRLNNISGKPRRALSSATMMSDDSAHSKPPRA